MSDVFSDNEFDFDEIRTKTLLSKLNVCAAGEHASKIERMIRTIKERTRAFCHSIPYTEIPRIMLKALISSSIQWMNVFPTKCGIQGKCSPAFLLEGKPNPDAKRKQIAFGTYALAYDMTTNTQRKKSHTVCCFK